MIFTTPSFSVYSFIGVSVLMFVLLILMFFLRRKKILGKNIFLNTRFFCIGVFFTVALFFLLISLLGPFLVSPSSEKTLGTNMMFAIDVSKSMEVMDIEMYEEDIARLGIVKKIVSDFVSKNPQNKYGLSIFSGDSQRVTPFANDRNIFLTILDGINNNNVSLGGSDIDRALEDAISSFTSDEKGGVLVLLTDGGDDIKYTKSEYIEDAISQKNIHLFIIGIGTRQGGLIPTGVDVFGNYRYKIYNGKEVISKRNDSFLEQIADSYNARYMTLGSISEYVSLLDEIQKDGEKQTILLDKQGKSIAYHFIWVSFLFFILGYFVFLIPSIGAKKYS